MNTRHIDVSVVIVSWNTQELVRECLKSLESARTRLSVEIILVDNASADDTVKLVREQFPWVKVVQNATNVGFAKANNIGIGISSGEYIALINSDVVVPDGCLEKMVDYLNQHTDIGMLGPKMILRDGSVGQSCYRSPTVWRWFCNAVGLNFVFEEDLAIDDSATKDFNHDKIREVDVLTGWFWMVRRKATDRIGVLDDQFFMYGEDLDWPKRFHDGGWRVVFYPEAYAIHYCGASSAQAPSRFYVEMNRANLQYFRKHHGLPGVVGFWLTTWLHQILRITGYCFVYMLNQSNRANAHYKVRRSIACLRWLMGLQKPSEVRR
jgi:GT2 family glycosyltransferase